MPKCCIKGCDSSKYIGNKDFTFFAFPLHNENLLQKWLNIIDVAGWNPSKLWICSMHFAKDDMQHSSNGVGPTLKPTSVPTIFPEHEPNTKVRTCFPRILMTLPLKPSSPTTKVGAKENSNSPITQSSPLILVPTQYVLQCQGQFPFLVSTQLLSQVNPPPMLQNSQTNVQNPGHFGQYSTPTSDQRSLGISQPSQTIVQDLLKSSEVSRASPQDPIKISQISPVNAHNPVETCRILQPNDRKTIRMPIISQVNGQNLARPAQFVQQAGVQNSTETSKLPQVNVPDPASPRKFLHPADRKSVPMSPISQANGQHPTQPAQFVQLARVQNSIKTPELSQVNAHTSARPYKFVQSNDRNQKQMLQAPQGNCRNSAQPAQIVQQVPTQSSFGKSVDIRYSNSSDTKGAQGMPDIPAIQSTTLCPASRKILPKPETSFAFKPEAVSKPDILIVPMCRNSNNKKGSELSVPVRYPGNKRPTLRITINKRYNIPPESKISAVTGEKGNASTGEDSVDKRITIENTSANKSVTFRLDHRTGEIHLENSEIVESSRTSQHARQRRIKRKVHTRGRPLSVKLRRRYTKSQREHDAL